MNAHHVQLERRPDHPAWHRWACLCGWATQWTCYTDPHAGPAAILHALRANREADR